MCHYNLTASACTDACRVGISAMAAVYEWALTADEVSRIDAMRFDQPEQPPTYYASSGCPTFNATEAKAMSSPCASSTLANAWC